jgi:hypothetical protein
MPSKRQFGAIALLLGGILAAIASFLPWVRSFYPAVADEPASTVFASPGQSLALTVQTSLTAPYRLLSIETPLELLLFWVVPILLAAIGISFLQRDRAPKRRTWVGCLILALLGGAWTILFAFLLVSFLGAFSVIRSTNTLEYGPGVGLLGYLCAFVGALLLRATPMPHTRVRM